jgi:hypothetical protein
MTLGVSERPAQQFLFKRKGFDDMALCQAAHTPQTQGIAI